MLKNEHTNPNHITISAEQDRRQPITPAAHELTPAQLELVVGGGYPVGPSTGHFSFVGTKR